MLSLILKKDCISNNRRNSAWQKTFLILWLLMAQGYLVAAIILYLGTDCYSLDPRINLLIWISSTIGLIVITLPSLGFLIIFAYRECARDNDLNKLIIKRRQSYELCRTSLGKENDLQFYYDYYKPLESSTTCLKEIELAYIRRYCIQKPSPNQVQLQDHSPKQQPKETQSPTQVRPTKQSILGNTELKTCSICLQDLNPDLSDMIVLPICRHSFHEQCISEWLGQKLYCPMCKANVRKNFISFVEAQLAVIKEKPIIG